MFVYVICYAFHCCSLCFDHFFGVGVEVTGSDTPNSQSSQSDANKIDSHAAEWPRNPSTIHGTQSIDDP